MGRLWTSAGGKRRPTAEGYRQMYKKYQSSAKAKAERASRNKARRAALRAGRVHIGDGKEIDHKDSNPKNNASSNLRVVSRYTNRSKKENSRRRGSRRSRSTWGK